LSKNAADPEVRRFRPEQPTLKRGIAPAAWSHSMQI